MFKISNKSPHSAHIINIEFELFKFPDGSLHFKMKDDLQVVNSVEIETDLCNSDEIMLLMLVSDYFKGKRKTLRLKYMPYSRQDRKTSRSEPFSLKTMCRLINSCEFDSVVLYDPHSDVTPALIDNCVVKKRVDLVNLDDFDKDTIIVSPDAGAMKANNEIALKYGFKHIVATKVRDIKTGEITETQLHTDINLNGNKLVVLDDICDGGRTFIELAKVLKEYNPHNIYLNVTVGIFSKGMEVLEPYFFDISCYHKLGGKNE